MLVWGQSKSTLDHSPKADNGATWTLLRNLLLNISKATEATAKILKFWPGTFSSTCSLWSSQPCLNHYLSQEPIHLIAQLSPRKILRFTSPGIGCLQGLSKRNQQFVAGFFRPPDKVIRAFRPLGATWLDPAVLEAVCCLKTNREPTGSAFQVTSGSGDIMRCHALQVEQNDPEPCQAKSLESLLIQR